ncbi:hypothetical protein N431DRAFT_559898 [Stipitochalara longipes BDJ]|nr:hypothetical protein N431DRAFT_559898 [Stipitochalara longipes BDJ]
MTPISYQLETGFPHGRDSTDMNLTLDQSLLPFLSDSASAYGGGYNDIGHDHGNIFDGSARMATEAHSPLRLASLDDTFYLANNETQAPEAVSVLGEDSSPSGLSSSEARATESFSTGDFSSSPAPRSPEKPHRPRSKCAYCSITLSRPSDLDRHMNTIHRHRRPRCSVPGCTNNRGKGFSRFDKYREHMRTQHPQ